MVNENIQGVIPLAGIGHTRHPRGNYGPGEFKNLVNAEITDEGVITTRRPILYTLNSQGTNTSTNGMQNANGFVGHYKDKVILAGVDCHKLVQANELGPAGNLWPTSDLLTGLTAGDFRIIVGFIRYNKVNYWITWTYIEVGDTFYYDLYYAADPVGGDVSDITFAMLTKVPIFDTITDPHTEAPILKSFFIHKERLWVVTQFKAYFSKATDPTIWAVPDGGFFNFLESQINDACALKDSVYVIADNSVHIITYTSDPNTDSSVRQITDGLGGDSCTINGDQVFLVRDQAIYVIDNQYVSKFIDLNVKSIYGPGGRWRIYSFGKYLTLIYSKLCARDLSSSVGESYDNPSIWFDLQDYHWVNYEPVLASLGFEDYTVFFVNTNNGSIHAVDYDGVGPISDFYFSPIENVNNNQYLYILCQKNNESSVNHASFVYSMLLTDGETPSDSCVDSNHQHQGLTSYLLKTDYPINIDVEIESYVPDGSEFFMKKFRNLMFEGELCKKMNVSFAFDNSSYQSPLVLEGVETFNSPRLPMPSRIPINQRARSISIRLTKDKVYEPEFNDSNFSISRLMLLWSYTGRGPVRNNTSMNEV